ncbi:MAG: hypothetical protein N4A44_00390 [Alphaproteobacteria bacterium]|jgi:hypothetical protein|nr:hypothetical protein [Alphaproteobacteria bacterium]
MKIKNFKNILIAGALISTAACSMNDFRDSENFSDVEVEQKYNDVNRYDNLARNKEISQSEIEYVKEKWYSNKVREKMETFKGHSFKVQYKFHTGELKEFRVLWVSDNNRAYPDTIENMISAVADRYMIRTCGNGMPITVYNEPSLGLTKYDLQEYKPTYGGGEVKEYGFRCLYNK